MRPEVLWVNYGRSPCRGGYELDANVYRVHVMCMIFTPPAKAPGEKNRVITGS